MPGLSVARNVYRTLLHEPRQVFWQIRQEQHRRHGLLQRLVRQRAACLMRHEERCINADDGLLGGGAHAGDDEREDGIV